MRRRHSTPNHHSPHQAAALSTSRHLNPPRSRDPPTEKPPRGSAVCAPPPPCGSTSCARSANRATSRHRPVRSATTTCALRQPNPSRQRRARPTTATRKRSLWALRQPYHLAAVPPRDSTPHLPLLTPQRGETLANRSSLHRRQHPPPGTTRFTTPRHPRSAAPHSTMRQYAPPAAPRSTTRRHSSPAATHSLHRPLPNPPCGISAQRGGTPRHHSNALCAVFLSAP